MRSRPHSRAAAANSRAPRRSSASKPPATPSEWTRKYAVVTPSSARRMASRSATSPSFRVSGRTVCPRRASSSARCEPTWPLAPVTAIVCRFLAVSVHVLSISAGWVSNVPDREPEEHAEEDVARRRRCEGARAREDRRPGAALHLRVKPVDHRDAGPEQRVLDDRRSHAGLHAPPAEALEEIAEGRPAARVRCEVREPFVLAARDERAEELGVGVRRVEGVLQDRVAGLPEGRGERSGDGASETHGAGLGELLA